MVSLAIVTSLCRADLAKANAAFDELVESSKMIEEEQSEQIRDLQAEVEEEVKDVEVCEVAQRGGIKRRRR